MAIKQDYYELLGINKNASPDEIKRAYRGLAMQYHPDKNPNNNQSEEKFKLINEAYEILSDPQKRSYYDQFGHTGPGLGNNFSQEGFSEFTDFNEVFGDIFSNFFGGTSTSGRRRQSSQRGSDLQLELKISFMEACFGVEKVIELNHMKICKSCGGTGALDEKSIETCKHCHGTGQVRHSQGFITFSSTCTYCRGAGKTITNLCPKCRGGRKISETTKINVKIPAGIDTGSKIKISGEGDSGYGGADNGDLYILINVKDHPIFRRDDTDIYCEVPISFTQAALGAEIEIPTLNGNDLLKIPAGTQNGKVFRFKGKGVPIINGFGRGDQNIKIVIETPTKLTSKQKELLKQFAQEEEETNNPIRKGFLDKVKDIFQK
ncbi:molecular chaperone DnaJ [Candidatus Desantisbacteria bacterium]|nr:molecular chaperone DnaJ [Candidatus Desantisbacteria bacterium]